MQQCKPALSQLSGCGLLRLANADDATGQTAPGMAGGQAVGEAPLAEVIRVSMHLGGQNEEEGGAWERE